MASDKDFPLSDEGKGLKIWKLCGHLYFQDLSSALGTGYESRTHDHGVKVRGLTAWLNPHKYDRLWLDGHVGYFLWMSLCRMDFPSVISTKAVISLNRSRLLSWYLFFISSPDRLVVMNTMRLLL